MSLLQMLFLLLIIFIIGFIVVNNKRQKVGKSAKVKKEEIKQEYIEQMQELIKKFKNSEKQLKQERVKFIKNVNEELSKNIFFNQEDIREIIYELTTM